MDYSDSRKFSEISLIRIIEQIIERDPSFQSWEREKRIGDSIVDMLLKRDDIILAVEVKRIAPQTTARLEDALAQVMAIKPWVMRQFPGHQVESVLVIPGVLSTSRMQAASAAGVEVWDRSWIVDHALSCGLEDEVYRLFDGVPREDGIELSESEILKSRLRAIQCGRTDWYSYQKLCGEILEYLFCPPLRAPIPESSNIPRINRRDFVVPNYVPDGFWHFMRLHYKADYIVVDAKNHCGQANKTHALQLANYLSPHGTGLFGMIVTRNGIDRAGAYTCREQWMLHSKMIITLNDGDLLQMIESRRNDLEPEDLIRQKIEDFRLGI